MAYAPASGSNISAMSDVTWTITGESPMTNTQFLTWWGDNVVYSTPDGSTSMHSRNDITFKDNTTYSEEYYTINDLGKIPSVTDYQTNGFSAYNQEMVLSGSEFTGTGSKIDLCVEPKIFIDAGLISK